MDYLFNNGRFFDFNNLFNNNFLSDNFRNFNNPLDYFFNNSRNLYWFLNFSSDFNNLFLFNIHIFDNLYGNMDNFFNFLNFNYFNHLLNNFLNWNHLWDLNYSIHNLFNYFLNFDDLWYNSEYLQDIINIDNIHNFSLNHSDNSLIKIQN